MASLRLAAVRVCARLDDRHAAWPDDRDRARLDDRDFAWLDGSAPLNTPQLSDRKVGLPAGVRIA